MNDLRPIELTVDALMEAAQSFAAGDHEQPMSNAQIRAERKRYFEEARARVQELKSVPQTHRWNTPTGHADVDALVWFDFVHTDEPWAQVPAVAPERLLPSRCGLFSEFPSRVQPALN